MTSHPLGASLFVTRDGYVALYHLGLTPDRITITLQSLEPARHGQALTFVRTGPRASITLYEEETIVGQHHAG